MILGFKSIFKPRILNGTKIHTIRADKHDRWGPGRVIQFATGVRTSNYEQFLEKECVSIQSFKIEWFRKNRYATLEIDGIRKCGINLVGKKIQILKTPSVNFDIQEFCLNDGFETVTEFLKFFGNTFEGKIIHWTDKRY